MFTSGPIAPDITSTGQGYSSDWWKEWKISFILTITWNADDADVKDFHGFIYKSQSNFFFFNRKLLLTTETELNAMAAPAIIGSRRMPNAGKRIPAATGMPMRL